MVETTPVVLVTGLSDDAMASTTLSLQWDLPHAVVLRHTLDVGTQRLTRLVSDMTGVVEHVHHDLDHACVSCALREDIVPTIERLAASRRWGAVIVHLPTAAEAHQVCRVTALDPHAAPHARITAVLTAVDAADVRADLLGDELLRERGAHTSEGDARGVGEVLCSMVEHADAVVVSGALDEPEHDLLRALMRPDSLLVPDPSRLDGPRFSGPLHDHDRTERWIDAVRRGSVPVPRSEHVWMLDLRSERALHPDRLLGSIESIGGGPRRSRGCFWLPTRPTSVNAWDGAGGQLSVGVHGAWGPGRRPLTRLVVHGLTADGDGADAVRETFQECLVSEREQSRRGRFWDVAEDGFEPWLGPVRHVA